MYFVDPDLYCQKKDLQDSVEHFFNKTLLHMDLKCEVDELVMDVGSGPGRVTSKVMAPLFGNMKKLYGIDLLPNMIEYAKTHNAHPKIEYCLASIEDWSTIERWKGKISKMLSVHCFNWLVNQKHGFENVYKLLQSGGQAAFLFCLHTPYFQAVVDIAEDPKWKDYFVNVHNCVPESHYKKYETAYYKRMLEEIGFIIVKIETTLVLDTFATDVLFRSFFASICVLVSHVPEERREEFKDDFFEYNLRLNGRNSKGQAIHKATVLELVVKKN